MRRKVRDSSIHIFAAIAFDRQRKPAFLKAVADLYKPVERIIQLEFR